MCMFQIVEGNESNWWEVGTTAMIGGALVEVPDHDYPWAFIAAGVGDCKAFHFHFTDKSTAALHLHCFDLPFILFG
jgi:hypothetical protein